MDQDVEMVDKPDSSGHIGKQEMIYPALSPSSSTVPQESHGTLEHPTSDSSLSQDVPFIMDHAVTHRHTPPASFSTSSGPPVIVSGSATEPNPPSATAFQALPSQSSTLAPLIDHGPSPSSQSRPDTPTSTADIVPSSKTPGPTPSSHNATSQHFQPQSPTPPSSHVKGKGKARVEDADEPDSACVPELDQEQHMTEEDEATMSTTTRRRPRPKPVLNENDPNLLFTGHMANPPQHPVISPTSATGFAELNLGTPVIDHDLTDQMGGVPKNAEKSLKEYVFSQLKGVGYHFAALDSERRNLVNSTIGEQHEMLEQADPGEPSKRPRLEPVRPSKKLKREVDRAEAIMKKDDTSKHQFGSRSDQPIPQGHKLYPGYNAQSDNSRKRKVAPFNDLSYRRTNNPNFNIFSDGILRQSDLLFHFASALPVKTLIALYSISRVFHRAMNHRFATMILSTAFIKAPESARIFTFRCYQPLTIDDPRHQVVSERLPHPDPKKAALGIPRRVPGFKWLQMVTYREKIVQEIMAMMAEDGVPLPPETATILKHIWFVMDFPDSARRVGYFHQSHLVTDLDLFYGMMFIVRLDMRMTSPTENYPVNTGAKLRRLILGQRSLSYLWKVLKGFKLKNEFEILKEWMRYKYNPTRIPGEQHLSMFDIPSHELGRGCLINWGRPALNSEGRWVVPKCVDKNMLARPDQILHRECIRRHLGISRWLKKMLLWGYVDMEKLRRHQFDPAEVIMNEDPPMNFDPEPRVIPRRIPGLEDEYSDSEEIGAPEIPSDERDRDPLLDLGPVKEKSIFVVQPDRQRLELAERNRRVNETDLLQRMMAVSESREHEKTPTHRSLSDHNTAPLNFLPDPPANNSNPAKTSANTHAERSTYAPWPRPPRSPPPPSDFSLQKKWPILQDHPEIYVDAENDEELWVHVADDKAYEEWLLRQQQLDQQREEDKETLEYFGLQEEDLLEEDSAFNQATNPDGGSSHATTSTDDAAPPTLPATDAPGSFDLAHPETLVGTPPPVLPSSPAGPPFQP